MEAVTKLSYFLKYLRIFRGRYFIYGGGRKLPVSQNILTGCHFIYESGHKLPISQNIFTVALTYCPSLKIYYQRQASSKIDLHFHPPLETGPKPTSRTNTGDLPQRMRARTDSNAHALGPIATCARCGALAVREHSKLPTRGFWVSTHGFWSPVPCLPSVQGPFNFWSLVLAFIFGQFSLFCVGLFFILYFSCLVFLIQDSGWWVVNGPGMVPFTYESTSYRYMVNIACF
jgi:hypothetical protein